MAKQAASSLATGLLAKRTSLTNDQCDRLHAHFFEMVAGPGARSTVAIESAPMTS